MKKVLDVCCGSKGMWFDKNDCRALFLDKRNIVYKNDNARGYKTVIVLPETQSQEKKDMLKNIKGEVINSFKL